MYGHIALLTEAESKKVRAVRRQLGKGDYDIKKRLNVALDKLIENLIAESSPEKMINRAECDASTSRTKILIVVDHAVVRHGLARLVESEYDLTVGAEVENAEQAMEAIEHQWFDLAIVDILLEDGNGLELTAKMKSRCPSMVVLVLSMYDGLLYAQHALRAGAAGYIVKYEAPEKIITAIHQVLGGKIYISNSKASRAI